MRDVSTCELCLREGVETTVHHLVPKEMGGTFLQVAQLCRVCHKQIHALYTNEELAIRINTVQLLREDPEIRKYLKWIRKQPPSKVPRVSKSVRRKKK